VIQFPETARIEWEAVADAANASASLARRIRREKRVEEATEDLWIRHEANQLFQSELDAEDTPVLEIGTLTDYLNNPAAAPADAIDGVMKMNGLCVVVGPSGAGKTSLALQMLHSLLTGDDWLGRITKKIDGSVGLLSYDMDASMIYDWMAGAPGIDPDKVSVVNAYRQGNPVGVTAMRQQIARVWREANTEVVLLDSFSASFFGKDQNNAAETMQHYRDMKRFALTEVGAKILIVIAHSTDSQPHKVRGSTVHKDASDTMVSVVVVENEKRKVSVEKYREARGQTMMQPVIVGAPDAVTHLVSLDVSAMSLHGLELPPGAQAEAFDSLPDEGYEEPDTDSTDFDGEGEEG